MGSGESLNSLSLRAHSIADDLGFVGLSDVWGIISHSDDSSHARLIGAQMVSLHIHRGGSQTVWVLRYSRGRSRQDHSASLRRQRWTGYESTRKCPGDESCGVEQDAWKNPRPGVPSTPSR